jgi:hypothetical protein
MRFMVFCITLIVAMGLSTINASAQISSNPVPLEVMNSIYWNIQKQMSFTSINEKSSLLWTPKVIELQSLEGESQLPSLYTPEETLFRLAFDVGIGHNMDETVVHWRKCEVVISLIGKNWGAPILNKCRF